MANTWFRLYSEFSDDPKVQMMPEAMQRRLIMLMCERCKDETFHETERAFHWRISEDELAETKKLFIAKGFIDKHWNLENWNKRQFISDGSTERVRKHRQAMKRSETLHPPSETFHETHVTPDVTAPDTDTDTETETEQKVHAPEPPANHLALLTEEIALASPAGVALGWTPNSVHGNSRALQPVIDAIILEAKDQGISEREAALWILKQVRSITEAQMREVGWERYWSARRAVNFWRDAEYRKPERFIERFTQGGSNGTAGRISNRNRTAGNGAAAQQALAALADASRTIEGSRGESDDSGRGARQDADPDAHRHLRGSAVGPKPPASDSSVLASLDRVPVLSAACASAGTGWDDF